ncbi:hypothetical protein C8R41DRAFT_359930 [Lentinula lateritia]|uniref:Uncharacterized protein n=1 Tax=Lentinula lateritia TaxID=40482 RepID=A0ABQ8VWY4_9AGAR|nr:hypothetical protein C8R41DRAFT_359930 [Lentinula lateritia]
MYIQCTYTAGIRLLGIYRYPLAVVWFFPQCRSLYLEIPLEAGSSYLSTRASIAATFLRFEQLASNMTTRSILLKIISLIMILQASALVFGRPIPRLQRRISPARASAGKAIRAHFGQSLTYHTITGSELMPGTNDQEMTYQRRTDDVDASRSYSRRVIVESEENVPTCVKADQCCTKCEAYLQSHNFDLSDQLETCVSLCQNDGIVGSIPKPTSRIGVTVLNKAQRSDRS